MVQDRLSGKLAVILHADVAGSTQMVQQDEHLAHERIQDTFRRFSATINEYSGQVLELRGDALLAEFERPSDAVSATLAFQSTQAELLSSLNDDLKPEVRVGIAMGEVVVADNTITGAGVVMAQRVEQLADTGGLCITAAVRESLSGRLSVEFDSLGQQDLKGFEESVAVFKVSLSENAVISLPASNEVSRISDFPWKIIGSLAIAALMIVTGIVYWINKGESLEETASLERMAFPLPDKPSIAVLPFTNMSNDAEQDFFADGMTEDLITDISKVSGLFVIARNSVFTYKGRAVKVRQVAEELGVRYVMEGSVRRAGNQVRINAQLIDATTGGHLWAERYDGSLDDVFTMQDKITKSIVNSLAITLTGQEQDNVDQVETNSAEAYDSFLRGWEKYRQATPENLGQAVNYLKLAIEMDPGYERSYSALAAAHWKIVENGWWHKSLGIPGTQAVEQARVYLKKAMEQPSALAHQVASDWAAFFRGTPDRALAEAERAIALDENDPAGHLAMANALLKANRPDEAIRSMQQAMRLDPHYPAYYLTRLGRAQFDQGSYQLAAATLEQSIERNPQDDRAYVFLVATYGHLGLKNEAETAIMNTNILRARAGWDELILSTVRNWKWAGDRKNLREGLAKAGVGPSHDWYFRIKRTGDNFDIEGVTNIDAEKAKQLQFRGVQFIDTGRSFVFEHVPGAKGLRWSRPSFSFAIPREFNEMRLLDIVDKRQEIVIYTSDSISDAALASAYAVDHGFQKVYFFQGGLEAWKTAGYPVETNN